MSEPTAQDRTATGTATGTDRIVVVGGTGNIGTSVLAALGADPGVGEIVALSRREPALAHPKVRWERTDVLTDELTEQLRGADAVIHLAWVFQPTHDPVTTWRNNVLGSLRLFEAVTSAGVPALIHASSVAAYSPGPGQRPVDEQWPTHGWPGAAYAREKAYLERYLDTYEHRNPDVRVVRMRTAFCFKAESASQQRRLFIGPFLPNRLARPGILPALPSLPGLRFQTVHSDDVGEAYRLATRSAAYGAFNIAAEPVVDTPTLARLFGTRTFSMPAWPVRTALATAWNLHLVPASPNLFDTFLRLPVMDTGRARTVLNWEPRYTATEAIREFVEGLQRGQGAPTPPLRSELDGGRAQEIETGVGQQQ